MNPLEARIYLPATNDTSGRFMFMPAGTHRIQCSRGGQPVEVTMLVDARSAAALNAQLLAVARAKAPQKPYCDFNHDKDKASFWPAQFTWQPDGVYVEGEFSASGRAAIAGRDYRGFSPTFYVDDVTASPAQVVCNELAGLNFGGLVNEPAFHQISPLWAKSAGAPSAVGEPPTQTEAMNHTIAELQAAKATLETQVKALEAKAVKTEIETALLDARRAELRSTEQAAQLAELAARDTARREQDATAAVQRAVQRGALAAQDTALQARWQTNCASHPDLIGMLEAIPAAGVALGGRQTRSVQVTRSSSADALNAFDAERDPRRRYALYTKEIKPRLAEGDPLPLDAANSPGTLAGTLVTQRTLELLKVTFPVLTCIGTDFSDQAARYNQTINTRIVGIPSVVDYDATNGWVDQDAVMTDVSVTLNKRQGVPVTFNSETLSSTARRLFEEIAPAQAYALAKSMVDALYALITSGNYSNATTAALNAFARSSVIDVGTALNKRGVPMGSANRTLLLSSDYFGALAKDSAIVTLSAYQRPEIITAGMLPDVHGFGVVDAPNLPTTGNLTGFGFSRSALCLVTRADGDYLNALPGASYGNAGIVTDPDLGISVQQVQYVNHQMASATQRISLLYGVAKGQPNAGQRIISA
ncbi:MAG: hypothetical protein EBS05_27075, partial [Proteobacteria bacterium]|nr:hypothetical protein [Pseudomonadota bacterium]